MSVNLRLYDRVRRGQVFMCDFFSDKEKENKSSSITAGQRPCLVVSNDKNNHYSSTCNVVPISTREDVSGPYQAFFLYDDRPQVVQTEQIKTVPMNSLRRYMYTISDDLMRDVEQCMLIQLGINIGFDLDQITGFTNLLEEAIDRMLQKKREEVREYQNISSGVEDVILRVSSGIESLLDMDSHILPTKDDSIIVEEIEEKIEKNDTPEEEPQTIIENETATTCKKSSNKPERRKLTLEECRIFLKDCDQLSLDDVVKKWSLRDKKHLYTLKYTCKRRIDKATD